MPVGAAYIESESRLVRWVGFIRCVDRTLARHRFPALATRALGREAEPSQPEGRNRHYFVVDHWRLKACFWGSGIVKLL